PSNNPPTTAAISERFGMFKLGANLPARLAASNAPSIMPKFIIEVISNHNDSDKALALPGFCQYAQEATSIPIKLTDLAAQTASAEVTPQGRPAKAKVAKFSKVRMIPPQTNGHGPRKKRFKPWVCA